MPVKPQDPALWQWLATPQATPLMAAASANTDNTPAQAVKLRKLADAVGTFAPLPLCTAAMQLAHARMKAARKQLPGASSLLADVEGVEQATSWPVALHKAARFAGHADALDLCCGIGADALAMQSLGVRITAVDADPVRVVMTAHNARCAAHVGDATAIDTAARLVHIDPARRVDGHRRFALDQLEPPAGAIAHAVRAARGAAVKLGPGVDVEEVRQVIGNGEVEFISDEGTLVQAVLWTGVLACQDISATSLRSGVAMTLHGSPAPVAFAPLGRYLCEADDSLERAGLLHLLDLPEPAAGLGLLTSDAAPTSTWLTVFEVVDVLPMRAERVKRRLVELDAGIVEVKTRGNACNTEPLQRDWRGKGKRPLCVFVLRFGDAVRAVITQRITDRTTPQREF